MRPAFLIAASLAAAVASAASPVGTWTGKFFIKMPPIPASAPPAQREFATKMMAQFKNGKIVMNMKADKTYTAKMVGISIGASGDESGTWSQTGNTVTIKDKRNPSHPQALEMSKDGKKMTLKLPKDQGQVVFTR